MILKVKHKVNYTVIPNQIFTDLTDGLAIGILAFMLSKPTDWEVNKSFCYGHFEQGRTRIDKAFKQLQEKGYVYKTLEHRKTGKFSGWVWVVTDTPKTDVRENRLSENRLSENVQQLSTIIQSTTNSNNKELSKELNYTSLLNFINKHTGKNYRVINPKVKKGFSARLKEGYTKTDIMNSIINACNSDHHKDSLYKYLTPEFFSRSKTLDMYGFEPKKKPGQNKPYVGAG